MSAPVEIGHEHKLVTLLPGIWIACPTCGKSYEVASE